MPIYTCRISPSVQVYPTTKSLLVSTQTAVHPSMGFHVLMVFFLTLIAPVLNHAAPPSEVYWQSVLPHTPMPKALHDLLPSEKKSDTSNGNSNQKPSSMNFKDNAIGFGLNIGSLGIDIGSDGVSVDLDHGGAIPFSFNYGHSNDQLTSNPNVSFYFLDKDLHPGTKMNLHFAKTEAKGKFLSRQVAEMIPFSSYKFSEILHQFSVKPNSKKADIMKKTIEECEKQALEGEAKFCATSLEAMVDFCMSKLGKYVQVMVTEVDKADKQKQEFSITQGVRMVGNEIVACHAQNYIYPVFYCHKMQTTRAYMVPLVGADQTKVKAVAVCHIDTSKWNPNHLAFQVLKAMPGTVPICHFLPEDHIIWLAK